MPHEIGRRQRQSRQAADDEYGPVQSVKRRGKSHVDRHHASIVADYGAPGNKIRTAARKDVQDFPTLGAWMK